jgi:hypothetical protein
VLLARSVLEPGEPFDVDVVLASRSETPTEYVDVSLVGEVGVAIPQGKTVAARQIQHVQRQAFRWTPGMLAVGDHRQRVRFVLPNWAPPSFRAAGGWCRVAYTVEVHVVIPMWIDRHAFFGLPVAAPAHLPAAETQTLVATHLNGPQSGAMYIECSLDATQVAPGEELRGDVSFANVMSKRIRRITLSIVGSERTHDPYHAMNAVMRYATTLVSGPPPEGESFPFRFALPANLWPSFDARLFGLVWTFEVRADVVLGADVVLTIPIDVVRMPPGVEPPPRSHRAAPVGNQRLARLWTIVAQRKGIDDDRLARRRVDDARARSVRRHARHRRRFSLPAPRARREARRARSLRFLGVHASLRSAERSGERALHGHRSRARAAAALLRSGAVDVPRHRGARGARR